MRIVEFDIPQYGWRVKTYFAVTQYNTEDIVGDLIDIDCPTNIVDRVTENLLHQEMDTGFTYSNKKNRSTIMVIGLTSHPAEFLNSFEHELRHLVDDIASVVGIDTNSEAVAYLTGDINLFLWGYIHKFVCCSCKH